MQTFIAMIGAVLCVFYAAAAAAEPYSRIHCDVTHSITCSKEGCVKNAESSAYINFIMVMPTGEGNLCTSTYCRGMRWLKLDLGSSPQTFGAVHSESSGSTLDKLGQPVVDYFLWISPERRSFTLIPADGYGNTWSGECKSKPNNSDS